MLVLILSVFFLTSKSGAVLATTIDHLDALHNHLKLKNPNKLRPVVNQSKPLGIYITFYVSDIVEINEVRQVMKINSAANISWKDELIHWNESEFGGIRSIVTDDFWMPIFSPIRIIGKSNVFEDSVKLARISSDGIVMWQPSVTLEIVCQMKMTYFPLDKQICGLELYPLQYTNKEIVCLKDTKALINTNLLLSPSNEWNIKKIYTYTLQRYDGFSEIRSTFSVHILIYREPLFYYQNIILPIVLLSFLSLFSFWLPDDSGERISFSLTVLLSLSVYLSTITQAMPATSEEIVYINVYMAFLLVNSCLICLVCIVLLKRHNLLKKQNSGSERLSKNVEPGLKPEELPSNPSIWQRLCNGNVYPFKMNPGSSRSSRRCCTSDVFLFFCFSSSWLLSSAVFLIKLTEEENDYEP